MHRTSIISQMLGSEPLPLWVPLLTHYKPGASGSAVDEGRQSRHARKVAASVRSWMVAGSTGDGWDINVEQFESLLGWAASVSATQSQVRILIGVLRSTTDDVLAWIDRIHHAVGTSRSASIETNVKRLAERRWVGITVCPPVGKDVSQPEIIAHYEKIADAARMPLGVYQLPQVTENTIAPDTLAELASRREEIILFKDSSGQDQVARSSVDMQGVVQVRGAEGSYASMLKPLGGPYDGLLLSTANNFGLNLRNLLTHITSNRYAEAEAAAGELTSIVDRVFAAVADAPVGNAFANANRAADHVLAYGSAWNEAPMPALFDGSRLPQSVVAAVAGILSEHDLIPERGYLAD